MILDLHSTVSKLRYYDSLSVTRKHELYLEAGLPNEVKSIIPTAFLFHEGRCGSTLVSNSVTVLNKETTRTYSEPKVALQALLACDKSRIHCNLEKATNLFRDTVYILGRTSDPIEDRLFLKLLPSSMLAIDVVKRAYPDTPWIFVYRDPVHVMVSNMRDPRSNYAPGPYCMAGHKREELYDEFTADVAARRGMTLGNLTTEEYCAAHLVRQLINIFLYFASCLCLTLRVRLP